MARPLGNKIYYLQQNLTQLRPRMERLFPLGFTHDEFLALFAPKEHWPILKSASEVADVTSNGGAHSGDLKDGRLDAEFVNYNFTVIRMPDGGDPPLSPRNHTVLKKAPPELVTRLVEWTNQQLKIRYDFATAAALMEWMGSHCESKHQIRFLWPSLVAIASLQEHTADFADRIRDFKVPRSLPPMPAEVRAACKMTSGLIAGAMLLPEEPEARAVPPVTVEICGGEAVHDGGALGEIRAA